MLISPVGLRCARIKPRGGLLLAAAPQPARLLFDPPFKSICLECMGCYRGNPGFSSAAAETRIQSSNSAAREVCIVAGTKNPMGFAWHRVRPAYRLCIHRASRVLKDERLQGAEFVRWARTG